MEKDRFKARFILGNVVTEVTGWDAHDIINKIIDEIDGVVEHACLDWSPIPVKEV